MKNLKLCRQWYKAGDYQRVIDALAPLKRLPPEGTYLLACAYAAGALPSEVDRFQEALELFEEVEEFEDRFDWNFYRAYAHMALNEAARAFPFVEQALEIEPDDKRAKALLELVRNNLAWPRFKAPFRVRVAEAWAAFEKENKRLTQLIAEDEEGNNMDKVMIGLKEILDIAFRDVEFVLESNTTSDELCLILSPGENPAKVFPLVYFVEHAPESLKQRWKFAVGHQPWALSDISLDEGTLKAQDVSIWLEEDDGFVHLSCYAEALTDNSNEDFIPYRLASELVYRMIGEIPRMRVISRIRLLDAPKPNPMGTLLDLATLLEERGFDLSLDPKNMTDVMEDYDFEPDPEEANSEFRFDIVSGSGCCALLANNYLDENDDTVDDLETDGIVAGFVAYPLKGLDAAAFKTKILERLAQADLTDSVRVIGTATGTHSGYVDFIAWDIDAVLKALVDLFAEPDSPIGIFHTFRRIGSKDVWLT